MILFLGLEKIVVHFELLQLENDLWFCSSYIEIFEFPIFNIYLVWQILSFNVFVGKNQISVGFICYCKMNLTC